MLYPKARHIRQSAGLPVGHNVYIRVRTIYAGCLSPHHQSYQIRAVPVSLLLPDFDTAPFPGQKAYHYLQETENAVPRRLPLSIMLTGPSHNY